MATIIRNSSFTRAKKSVKPDTKKRVILPKELVGKDVIFHVYSNVSGQILLDPQVMIPASELWVFENKDILASLDKAMEDVKHGRVTKIDLENL